MDRYTKEEVFDLAKELCKIATDTGSEITSEFIKKLHYLGDFHEFLMEIEDLDGFPEGTHIFEGETSGDEEGIGVTLAMPNEYELHLFIPYEFIDEPEKFRYKMELIRLECRLEVETWMKKIHEAQVKDHQASLEASKKMIEKYKRMIAELKIKQNGGKITY